MNRAIALSALFAMCCVPLPASADGRQTPVPYFYDGVKKITLNLEPGLVAEFVHAETESAVKKASPEAIELKAGVGGPRVFKAPATSFKARTATGSTTSPVFRTSPAARLMALPGGVVVTFKPEWTDAQVREFASAKGLEVQQRLEITGNWYVLKTEPGLASLETANRLHESGEVVSATPNWWKETVTR